MNSYIGNVWNSTQRIVSTQLLAAAAVTANSRTGIRTEDPSFPVQCSVDRLHLLAL